MTPEDLRDWLKRYGHSLTTGSDVLGISRRALQQYLAGNERIPLPVARLMWALDRIAAHEAGRINFANNQDIMLFPERHETVEEPEAHHG